ncbi:hypothetical protein GCM10010345_91250 [Streptomyces canarius]|uniref:TrwC relaxase domain-containing protein n=1 Tax=Streptomyces canarius TaxID=285453 RepID=A0ABQ3DBL2_9ACTN|nr:hypothetical protein GCM10010345_91250 [Streptomyces canarius]
MEGQELGRGRSQGRGRGDERQAELLLGEGRHPDADRIERELLAQGKSPARARRATVLGRPIEHNRSPKTDRAKERIPWLGMHLVFRPPPTAHVAWALADYETRRVLELCQDIARDKTLAWLEDAVAQIRWKGGGKHRARVKDGGTSWARLPASLAIAATPADVRLGLTKVVGVGQRVESPTP